MKALIQLALLLMIASLWLTACQPGPATEAEIQRMKDNAASELGDVASFKSSFRQEARSRGESWDTIEAVAEVLDFETYRVCSLALFNSVVDDAVESNPGATVEVLEKATIEILESPQYQADQAECIEASLAD